MEVKFHLGLFCGLCWTSEKEVGFFSGCEGGGVERVLVHDKV